MLRSSNINEDIFILNHDDVFVEPQAINIDFVKENDILITAANGSNRLIGKHALIEKTPENAVHGGFMLLASSDEPQFINALMSSAWYDKFTSIYVAGGNGAIGNLSKSNLDEQTISVPTVPEQQKIAALFTALNRLIILHQRELLKLQNMKKSLLEKMFV